MTDFVTISDREHLVHIARQNLRHFKSDEELAEWIADLLEQIKEQEL